MRDNLDPPYDEGDSLGRAGLIIAWVMAALGLGAMVLLWWLW